jgi:hypothetical protein
MNFPGWPVLIAGAAAGAILGASTRTALETARRGPAPPWLRFGQGGTASILGNALLKLAVVLAAVGGVPHAILVASQAYPLAAEQRRALGLSLLAALFVVRTARHFYWRRRLSPGIEPMR